MKEHGKTNAGILQFKTLRIKIFSFFVRKKKKLIQSNLNNAYCLLVLELTILDKHPLCALVNCHTPF